MHSLNQWILYNWWPLLLRYSFWYTKEFQSIRESPHWPRNPSKEWDYPSRGKEFFKCHLKRSFCLIIATGLMLPQQVYKTVDIPLAWQRFSAWAKILPYNQVALPFFKTLFCCCSIQVRDLLHYLAKCLQREAARALQTWLRLFFTSPAMVELRSNLKQMEMWKTFCYHKVTTLAILSIV